MPAFSQPFYSLRSGTGARGAAPLPAEQNRWHCTCCCRPAVSVAPGAPSRCPPHPKGFPGSSSQSRATPAPAPAPALPRFTALPLCPAPGQPPGQAAAARGWCSRLRSSRPATLVLPQLETTLPASLRRGEHPQRRAAAAAAAREQRGRWDEPWHRAQGEGLLAASAAGPGAAPAAPALAYASPAPGCCFPCREARPWQAALERAAC